MEMEVSEGHADWPAEEPANKRPRTEAAASSSSAAAGSSSCTHEIVLPSTSISPPPLLAEPADFPAFKFPFTLDAFQRKALAAIEAGESVMVSAHTSAGKTVVAQYAIAVSLAKRQRVVYTSPIKALSNQKYRELSADFKGDVG